jgi:hypothetical protein
MEYGDTMYCGECGKPCEVEKQECGFGELDVMGSVINDVRYKLVSSCCDGEIFEDEKLTIPWEG